MTVHTQELHPKKARNRREENNEMLPQEPTTPKNAGLDFNPQWLSWHQPKLDIEAVIQLTRV